MNLKSQFYKITMSSILPFNVSLLGLNTKAKEFKPQFNSPILTTPPPTPPPMSYKDENVFFDNLEQDFVKNNEWLFFV
jgi:hypothetical protein